MTHSDLVEALVKPGYRIVEEMTNSQANLIHMVMGISGESGEILDAIKKHVIYHKPIDRENVVEELGDLEFYVEGLRQALNISREEVIDHNIAKLTKRYGENYSDSAAIERIDKDE